MISNPLKSRRGRARVYRPLAEPLEDRKLLASLLALTDANSLVRFDSTTLAQSGSTLAVSVPAGETVRAIDVRPSNGALYALTTRPVGAGVSTLSVAKLYTISLTNTAATAQAVNPSSTFLVESGQISMDFNPMSDRLRVVTETNGLSIVVDPATGSAIQYDQALTFAPGYTPAPPAGAIPNITAIAYGNNVPGATSTTLFGYESDQEDLVTIAIASGAVTKVRDIPSGLGLTEFRGLDIDGASNTAFAARDNLVLGNSQLLTVGLDAGGATTTVGVIPLPAATRVRDLAVAPAPRVQFEFADYQFDETVGNATGRVRRTGDLTGPVTVTFQTTATGTATAGADFTTTTSTLTFADGQEFATFSVAITNDALAEPVETIGVSLTGPSTGSTLGSQSTATLTIRANDPDSTAPDVQSVRPTIVGRRRNRRIESIEVRFTESISEDRAENLANYEIRRAGPRRRSPFTTIRLRSAEYNNSTQTVTLIPVSSIRIDRLVQLVIRGIAPDGIADPAGNFLTGGDQTRRLS